MTNLFPLQRTPHGTVLARWERLAAATLLTGALALTACARNDVAQHHPHAAPVMTAVTGHPPIPGENLPDPARSELEGAALGRMQSGGVFSHF